MAKVRFNQVGDKKGIQELDLPEGATVADLLKETGVRDTREVRVNNNIASEATELKEDDLVMALPRVVGG
jgi:sulfur carrier protein ThiS